MGGDAPDAPDPQKTASAQFDYNMGAGVASGIINNPNVVGPGGSTNYKQSSTETITLPNGQKVQVPRYTQTTTLSKAQQQQYNQRQAMISQLMGQTGKVMGQNPTAGAPKYQSTYNSGKLQTGFTAGAPTVGFGNVNPTQQMYGQMTGNTKAYTDKLNLDEYNQQMALKGFNPSYTGGDLQTSYTPEGGFSEDRRRVEEAMMGRADALTKSTRDSEIARLSAMGLAPGSEKYGRVADQFEKAQNDRAMAAILAGGDEQSRLLGEARAAAGFGNQAMEQAYGMDMGLTQAQNDRIAQQMGFNRDTMNMNNASRTAEAQFGFGVNQAENARRMGEAEFGRGTVAQNNAARETQANLQMAKTEMENARRRGDAQAYNAAKEAYNNATIAQTQMNAGKAQFSNQTRQAMIQEMLGLQGNKLNQLLSLMTGQQQSNPNAPSFQGQGVNAPDYSGLVSDNYAQQVGAYNNRMTGLAGLGGIGLKALFGMA